MFEISWVKVVWSDLKKALRTYLNKIVIICNQKIY